MTTAHQRTQAVIESREFLQLLALPTCAASRDAVAEAALQLLRHYPLNIDLEISAAALPGIWASLRSEPSHWTRVRVKPGAHHATSGRIVPLINDFASGRQDVAGCCEGS